MTPLARYERKEWLTALPAPHSPAQALVDAICRYQWSGWLFVLVQHHSCCWIIINKYQTLASGVTSQRYHLRWHTPHSKRFASSWNILELSNKPHEKHCFETHNDISGELMRLATGRTDPASPGGGPRQPPNHSTSHLGEPRFLYPF